MGSYLSDGGGGGHDVGELEGCGFDVVVDVVVVWEWGGVSGGRLHVPPQQHGEFLALARSLASSHSRKRLKIDWIIKGEGM